MYKKFLFVLIISASFIIQSCEKDEETDPTTSVLSIGDFHEGGVIFYLDETGEHGFVCAVIDQSYGCPWGCPPLILDGANGLAIGTGAQNTADILSACSSSDIAAAICDDLQLNEKDDWFLPSKDELNLMYQESEAINETSRANGGDNIQETNYWTSSHANSTSVWVQNFNGGNQYGNAEDVWNHVRAIRAF